MPEPPRTCTGSLYERRHGTQEWGYRLSHREDGPAIVGAHDAPMEWTYMVWCREGNPIRSVYRSKVEEHCA